jgi:soluble lytic murein transglycosylase-like protein
MATKANLTNSLTRRSAKLRVRLRSHPLLRWLGGRGAAALALGAALSVGGINEAMHDSHFLVVKDLDAVRVVKQEGRRSEVVAKVSDGFAANSLFKLSRALPDALVTRKLALFDGKWLPATGLPQPRKADETVFHAEMRRINDAIRADFFANAVPFGDIIHEKAQKYDVDPALVAAVMETESRFQTKARSQVGAKGLMQLMPKTGRWLGARNLYDPAQNVDAGVKYLKYLDSRFPGNLKKTIAAYNAGEGNVRRYNGIPPFRETRGYVTRVLSRYEKRKAELKQFEAQGAPAPPPDGVMTLR